ncbi:hypothetical protein [Dethiothermospora halolimnae]|uniref:hypothetical protein n=1 Tax=Dethiothermospora halolimnae TaxID=3114390 RepID=UPI003CCBF8B8
MGNNCDKYKSKLIDIFYGEDKMTEEIKCHINNCSQCMKYWEELNQVREELDIFDEDIPIEYEKVNAVFKQVDVINNKRKNILSLISFIILSSIILAIGVLLALMGYGREILLLQTTSYLISPIIMLFIIKIRSRKENYHGRT